MERVDQLVERGQAVLFRDTAQMRIPGCGGGTGMAQQGLDMTEA